MNTKNRAKDRAGSRDKKLHYQMIKSEKAPAKPPEAVPIVLVISVSTVLQLLSVPLAVHGTEAPLR